MNVKELFDAGNLDEAVQAALAQVRLHPGDVPRRSTLAELLCWTGDLERADGQLETLGRQDPGSQFGVSLFRQLVRAAVARRQFYGEGRLPEFLGPPSPRLQLHLQASIALREDRPAEAAELLAQAETQRLPTPGTCNGQAFDDFRDLDDVTASCFEVLTTTGKYYWVPMERVSEIEFQRPAGLRDLLWRRVRMMVRDGPDGEVFLPVLYAGSETDADPRVRLGRYSDWRGGDGAPVRGVGQRTFLAGEQDMSILEIESLTFQPLGAAA
jgi:type VI secretion system protein ImpE